MATIEILGWKDGFRGFTGWDDYAKSELRKRLRRGLKASPAEIRRTARQIDARLPLCLLDVNEEAVFGLIQILKTTGAELRVSVERGRVEGLFEKWPKRGRFSARIAQKMNRLASRRLNATPNDDDPG